MKRTISKMLGIAALAIAGIGGSLIATTPAHAQVPPPATCSNYAGNGVYPGANNKFKLCFPSTQPIDTQRRNDIFNAIQQLPRATTQPTIPEVRNVLQNAGVTYHYVYDRDYWNRYVTAVGLPSNFQDATARCGVTKASLTGTITVAIFEVCQKTDGSRFINPELVRTSYHESGHALGFAIGKQYRGGTGNGPDKSAAWISLMMYDLSVITPSDWNTNPTKWTAFQKSNFICGIFNSIPLSSLELDLGGTPQLEVCNSSLALNSAFLNRTPRQIFEQKLPYFVGNNGTAPNTDTNLELWAELFNIRHNGTDPTQVNFLKQTDQALGKGAYNDSNAVFRCTKIAMQYFYIDPNQIPQASAFVGCPAVNW